MAAVDLEKWWSGLKVTEKERVASKIAGRQVFYPECTAVWNGVPSDKKESIYEHCVGRHGYLDKEEFEGNPLTD